MTNSYGRVCGAKRAEDRIAVRPESANLQATIHNVRYRVLERRSSSTSASWTICCVVGWPHGTIG